MPQSHKALNILQPLGDQFISATFNHTRQVGVQLLIIHIFGGWQQALGDWSPTDRQDILAGTHPLEGKICIGQ